MLRPRKSPPKLPVADRLLAKINVSLSGCWEWTACRDADGYGFFKMDGKMRRAHRASYEVHVGPIPPEMKVCHECDNPRCINPVHLFLGTHSENEADKNAKGRRPRGLRGAACPTAKLTEADVIAIRAINGIPQHAIAKQYGVCQTQISRIRLGKNWAET